jgi:hypothetical protein
MEKTILFIAAGIIAFCIVPIATTQAMPQQIQRGNSFASTDPLYVLNQKELRNMGMGLNNPGNNDNVFTYDMKVLHGKMTTNDSILMAGRAHVHSDQQSHLKKPEPVPYIVDDEGEEPDDDDDSGLERAHVRTGQLSHLEKPEPVPYIVDDEGKEPDDDEQNEDEDEEFGDDSAVKYNRDL